MKRSIKRLLCIAMSLCILAAMALTVSAETIYFCGHSAPPGSSVGAYVMVDLDYQDIPYLYAQAYTVCYTATSVEAYVYMIYNSVQRSDSAAGSMQAVAELGPYQPYEYDYIGPNVRSWSCNHTFNF